MTNDPLGLSAEAAKLMASWALPASPKQIIPEAPAAPKLPEQDVVDISAQAQSNATAEPQQALLTNLANAVSSHQAVDATLARIETVLQRMLTLAELAQDPNLPAAQRSAHAAEFVELQALVKNLDGGTQPAAASLKGRENQTFYSLYGVPLETQWQKIVEELEEKSGRRRNQPRSRLRPKLPKCTVIVLAMEHWRLVEETLSSVIDQEYPDFECIVVASLTEAASLPRKWRERIQVRENPAGDFWWSAIADAVQSSAGEIIMWLRPGEILAPHCLQTVGSLALRNPEVEWITGRPCFMGSETIKVAPQLMVWSEEALAETGDRPFHLRAFWKKSLWEKITAHSMPEEASPWQIAVQMFRKARLFYINTILLAIPDEGAVIAAQTAAGAESHTPSGSQGSALLRLDDLLPLEPKIAIDLLLQQAKESVGQNDWHRGLAFARTLAAAEPDSAELLQLEAFCAAQLGRKTEARLLLENLALRNRSPSGQGE